MAVSARLSHDASYYAVVVDANTFISGAISSLPSSLLSSPLLSTEEVRAEVRDARAKHVFDTLPFEFKTRQPAESSVEAVKKFAAATGDLTKLSDTDINLIALTHQMEVEANGTKYIRDVPPSMETIAGRLSASTRVEKPATDTSGVPCKFFSSAKGCRAGSQCRFAHVAAESTVAESHETDEKPVAGATAVAADVDADEGEWESVPMKSKPKKHNKTARADVESVVKAPVAVKSETAAPVEVNTQKPADKASEADPAAAVGAGEADVETEPWDSDGEGEWIAPSAEGDMTADALVFGYEKLSSSHGINDDTDLPPERKLVVCITSDFAMQNVLLQMGLNLASPAGKLIRSVKQWVLKCDACFTLVTDMTRLFCPRCGNATLARLGVTLGADGTPRFHYKKRRDFNLRGTNFALPKPKGGREGDLLLREDQLLTGYWAQKAKLKVVKTSVFADRAVGDIDNPSLGLTKVLNPEIVVGYGRKNPNEVRRKRR